MLSKQKIEDFLNKLSSLLIFNQCVLPLITIIWFEYFSLFKVTSIQILPNIDRAKITAFIYFPSNFLSLRSKVGNRTVLFCVSTFNLSSYSDNFVKWRKHKFKRIVMEENYLLILTLEGKNKQSIASHLLQVNWNSIPLKSLATF